MSNNCLKAKPLNDYNFKRYIFMKKLQLPNKSIMIKSEKNHYFTITDKSVDLGVDHYWLLTASPAHTQKSNRCFMHPEGRTHLNLQGSFAKKIK